jgi:transposase
MMGERSAQEKLFAADHMYLDYVGRDTLYGYLAQHRGHLFRDEDFGVLYCRNNGRPSVPPSLAVSVLFLRAYDGVSFVEAIERTKYDLRWKVALGLELEEVPIQKSALAEFQARLILHEQGEALLKKSIEEARRAGYLESRKIRVALDTTPTLGKGAVKDTYNLLADGIEKLACRLAEVTGEANRAWAEQAGLQRYFGSSLKGEAAIDWDDKAQRDQLLTQIVEDGRRLLSVADEIGNQYPEHEAAIQTDAALLKRLIDQDVEEKPGGGCQVKEGTEKDRLISVHDPEMRHGRKSAVDMDSQLICGVEVLAGNAGDQQQALELVHQAERVMEAEVEETVGDCAYGGGPTRRAFADERRLLTAKVPSIHNGDCFSKNAFTIDLDRMEVRCPAGKTTTAYESKGTGRGGRFMFADATCQSCCLRSQCTTGTRGRTIGIQPEERLQQQARAHNQTEAGRRSLRQRVVVEHRIARLVRLGVRQSRYIGKIKTRFQVFLAAVVANLSLVVGFSRQKSNSTIDTTVDRASQTLGILTAPSIRAKNGIWVNIWNASIRQAHSLFQMALSGSLCRAFPDFSYLNFPV